MFNLYDLFQDHRLSGAEARASQARSAAANAQSREQRLSAQVDTLTLACAAMWALLSEKCGATPDELVAKMTELDLRDGVRDGRLAPHGRKCSGCGRVNSAQRLLCLYCGQEQTPAGPFPLS